MFKSGTKIFSPTGGLVYHLRARIYQRRLWAPFKKELQSWFAHMTAGLKFLESSDFLLIGPSGGYFFPVEWWQALNLKTEPTSWTLVDPDPLALVRMRALWMKTVSKEARKLHQLVLVNSELDAQFVKTFQETVTDGQQLSILFCNLVGQLCNASSKTQATWREAIQELNPLLTQAKWASYHDKYSFEFPQKIDPRLDHTKWADFQKEVKKGDFSAEKWVRALSEFLPQVMSPKPGAAQDGIARTLLAGPHENHVANLALNLPVQLEVIDHDPTVFLPALLTKRNAWGGVWEIKPSHFHFIQGLW